MATTTLTVDIQYDPNATDPEGLACAMDRLLKTALSTPGILDDYANPTIGEFFVAQGNDGSQVRRWVLYDHDVDRMVTTTAYHSYDEAVEAAEQLNDVLVLPLAYQEMTMDPGDQTTRDDPQEPDHGQP